MKYAEKRMTLINYLKLKIEQCDWHGARDCCVDIELLEARFSREAEKTCEEIFKPTANTTSTVVRGQAQEGAHYLRGQTTSP